jgi:mitochondrial fission protein ELM1
MLSEACAVGCPVATFVAAPLPPKIRRFHQALREAGQLHDLDGTTARPPPPLRETAAIATDLRVLIAQKQSG